MDLTNTVQIYQLLLGSLSFIVLVVGVRIHQYNSAMIKCNAIADEIATMSALNLSTKSVHFHDN